jgi:GTP pyrophosphokinase
LDITGRPAFAGSQPHSPATAHPLYRWRTRLTASMPWSRPPGDPVDDLIRAHRQHHPRSDISVLRRSFAVADQMHSGQMRKSGEPYITHPLAVARILAELGMDTTTLVAALLHDTVEDTSYDLRTLRNEFGSEVALLVDGVTKLEKAYFGEDAEVETIRKMLDRAGQDVRVLIIKLADRLHNMRTLDARSPASRSRIAKATLDVLVPLCDRLGIQALKRNLEDSVLFNLEPEVYADIDDHVQNRPLWTNTLEQTIVTVRKALNAARIDADVAARPRHYYSIWRDTIAVGNPLTYDLPRIAIVIDGPRTDCYTALGTLHSMWHPVPGRFKDFIASPKNNLYKSLHTTVIGPDNRPVEVLIRTEGMHQFAEFGIVTNFRDPTSAARLDDRDRAEQLGWLRRVVDWQHIADDADKFLDALRCHLSEAQIQIFTASGKAVLLPAGSTPVDVAYNVDVALGHGCVAATVNGRLARLSTVLHDGDVVDIVTRDTKQVSLGIGRGPAREWLEFVKSPQALLEITRWHNMTLADGDTGEYPEQPEPTGTVADRMRLGRAAIALALREQDRLLSGDGPLHEVAAHMGYPELDALLVAIADRKVQAADIVTRLIALVDHPAPTRTP